LLSNSWPQRQQVRNDGGNSPVFMMVDPQDDKSLTALASVCRVFLEALICWENSLTLKSQMVYPQHRIASSPEEDPWTPILLRLERLQAECADRCPHQLQNQLTVRLCSAFVAEPAWVHSPVVNKLKGDVRNF
jgi:hypothetical protein